jgi:hypothetical protein
VVSLIREMQRVGESLADEVKKEKEEGSRCKRDRESRETEGSKGDRTA